MIIDKGSNIKTLQLKNTKNYFVTLGENWFIQIGGNNDIH